MSDLISRQGVIKAIDRFIPADPMENDYTQGISVGLAIATGCIEKFSQENTESSQGLVKGLISRNEMLRTYQELCMNISCSECSFYFGDVLTGDCMLEKWIHSLPSAEKTQLSEEDATSVCKCPCEYREPCDYCHYDAYRGHGCPAEEGLKDE